MTRKEAGLVTLALMAVVGVTVGYVAGHARAAGIAKTKAMTYRGVLTEASGVPLTGSKNIQIAMWDAATEGAQQCTVGPAPQTLAGGAFQVALPDACTAAVHANPDLWVEVFVDGASLGRVKLGTAPYAVEAEHASSADLAQQANGAAGTLEQRIAALENRKVHAGTASFTNGNCTTVTEPCTIDISAGKFQSAPHCTLTMTNVDNTGYTEHMVIKSITATALNVWRGQFYQPNGTTMVVEYICVGS